jgi:hypothetical protein
MPFLCRASSLHNRWSLDLKNETEMRKEYHERTEVYRGCLDLHERSSIPDELRGSRIGGRHPTSISDYYLHTSLLYARSRDTPHYRL